MKKVMTLRMPEEDIATVERISKEEKQDKSTTVRELVKLGRTYKAMQQYKEGTTSLGKAAETADLTISEMIETLAEMGIESNLEKEDYLEGKELAQDLI